MRVTTTGTSFSATDLADFLACHRKTELELAVARHALSRPAGDDADPVLALLRERGEAHERAFIDRERANGFEIVDLSPLKTDTRSTRNDRVAATRSTMQRGAARIVQAALQSTDGRWFGYADVLRRVERPSDLGTWSYEALDTKLAQETKGATILQLSLYSDLLGTLQGCVPESFHVVTPLREESYRVQEYAAYYRLVARGLAAHADRASLETYPEPVAHCQICAWQGPCEARRRRDDHLSFVANCAKIQRTELATHGVTTLATLGRDGLPVGFAPARGAMATYVRLQDQARLQLAARDSGVPTVEPLPVLPDLGLCLLPPPSPGDVFLDLEGATFARDGGREYLFGLVTVGPDGASRYDSFAAFTDAEERHAFESVVDRLITAFDADPAMHVYHYAPYEPTAFKKLMGRYATRGPEVDRLLRAERFVDLYGVVRHAIRAGIESYSIKALEQFYGYTRQVALDVAGPSRRLVEAALDRGLLGDVTEKDFALVVGYNEDDCVSTWRLREWLETLRTEAIARGADVPRPVVEIKSEPVGDLEAQARELRLRLLENLPADPSIWIADERARHLLAYSCDWHTRETKATWWEFFRLRDLPPEDQIDEPMAVVGLERLERVSEVMSAKTKRPTGSVIERYRYAEGQEMEIDEGDELLLADGKKWADVVAADRAARTLDLKIGAKRLDRTPTAAFSFFGVSTVPIQKSILAFAEEVAAHGWPGAPDDGRRALLLRERPRLMGATFDPTVDEDACAFATRIAPLLDRTVLAIQGPPGTGKSYTGARMICALVNAGKKVGVTASSHKVIRNLLKGVVKESSHWQTPVRVGHRCGTPLNDGDTILEFDDNVPALAHLASNAIDVLGGTAWLWSASDAAGVVDVLFVDEAGQMSLANVIGAGRAAASLVLLGDQQQLDQPNKASHPDGTNVSALSHILDGARTMPVDRGIFLPVTRRLAPGICTFTSEVFYEDRLTGLPELTFQRLASPSPFSEGALWVAGVAHDGNQSYSNEEVDVAIGLVGRLLAEGSWIDRDGCDPPRPIRPNDILVVAPYNAQVTRLTRRLPSGVRVGTVDKFQGQEAPVVIYSMATSRAEEAPRGMEFLYSLNRLNVATSRAQCAVIVVCSPALFEPACTTPRQMALASALGRYRELARDV